VLLLLCAVALTLHGCLLDGMPLDVPEPPQAGAPAAISVQVRAVPMAGDAVEPVSAPRQLDVPVPTTSTGLPQPALASRQTAAVEPGAMSAATGARVDFDAPGAASAVGSGVEGEVARPPAEGAPLVGSPVPVPVTPEPAKPVLRQVERAVPVYRTRIPPATVLAYEIRRGMFSGSGELTWRPAAGRYEMRLQLGVAGFNVLMQASQGGFDASGLAPVRFTDQRGHRPARAANFQRDAHKITYSSTHDEYALPEGSQDRLSWMIQLPAVLAAEPKRAQPGGEVLMVVSGARADVAVWTFAFVAAETIETVGGLVRTLRFTRTPQGPKDLLADVWLDPARHHLPVRVQLSQGEDADVLEMLLREQRSPATP
jgi:hypothetical protein